MEERLLSFLDTMCHEDSRTKGRVRELVGQHDLTGATDAHTEGGMKLAILQLISDLYHAADGDRGPIHDAIHMFHCLECGSKFKRLSRTFVDRVLERYVCVARDLFPDELGALLDAIYAGEPREHILAILREGPHDRKDPRGCVVYNVLSSIIDNNLSSFRHLSKAVHEIFFPYRERKVNESL